MIGLTTGRETNQRLNSLLRDLAHSIPNAVIIRRGKSSLQELTDRLRGKNILCVLLVHRFHGGPGRIDLFRVLEKGLSMVPPTMILSGVRLRREYGAGNRGPATAISLEHNSSVELLRLGTSLGMTLDLPVIEITSPPTHETSLHLRQEPRGTISLAVTSPPGREIGPRLTISKLVWESSENE